MRFVAHVFFGLMLFVFVSPPPALAQTTPAKNNPLSYALIWSADDTPEDTIEIMHNNLFTLPLGVEKRLSLDFDHSVGVGAVEGELFYLPGDGSRELLANVSDFSRPLFVWEQAGNYEFDVYEVPLIVSAVGEPVPLNEPTPPITAAISPGSVYLATMEFQVQSDGTVPPPEPTCTLTANPTSITEGTSAVLAWASEHADTVTIDNGIGVVATSGSVSVSPNADTTYIATFTGEGGEVSCDATVYVTPAPPAPQTLGEQAAALAIQLVDQPDGYLWGGKGWDFELGEFVPATVILSGYNYYNPEKYYDPVSDKYTGGVDYDIGVDCSGLIAWAYNFANNANVPFIKNFIAYENAAGQATDAQSVSVTEENLLPGDTLYFDFNSDGKIDHTAMYVGDQSGYDVVNASQPLVGIQSEIQALFTNINTFEFFRRPKNAQVSMSIEGSSPIDLIVIDPDGNEISFDTAVVTEREYIREIPGELYYSESVQGHDGNPADVVYSPKLKNGQYRISVVSNTDAAATDTYSLSFTAGEKIVVLANNVPIADIPSQGFVVSVEDGDIEVVEVALSPEDLFAKLEEVAKQADIHPKLLKISVSTHIAVAKKLYEHDRYRLAILSLKSLQELIERRTNKGIDGQDADLLLSIIKELITTIKDV